MLKLSATTLATGAVGIAATGTASASYFGKGQRVRLTDPAPCWYGGVNSCDDLEDWYQMPEGAKGECIENQQEWDCGTFVKLDHIDFNLPAYVNTDLLAHDNDINPDL
ncbi:hypothetical protein CP557_16235 [Natrinema ejinorense]|uniref:Uncharacterized protein n=1 Tax=Natrinema ejinorense TaxID=373386 RepID=A0A2A5QYT8_9EURY|nr:hypothetical protein CP557_16235 [Natrinema ejinorense]